jgi:hypothetical protein
MAILLRNQKGKILYAIAYETPQRAGFMYMHADDRDQVATTLIRHARELRKEMRIVNIAPAIGFYGKPEEKPIRVYMP